MSVRVRIDSASDGETAAGILLTYGRAFILFRLVKGWESRDQPGCSHLTSEIHDPENNQQGGANHGNDPLWASPVYLRVLRRGDTLTMTASRDGKLWEDVEEYPASWIKLPQRMKVGVAHGNVEGSFTAHFDQFEIKQLED